MEYLKVRRVSLAVKETGKRRDTGGEGGGGEADKISLHCGTAPRRWGGAPFSPSPEGSGEDVLGGTGEGGGHGGAPHGAAEGSARLSCPRPFSRPCLLFARRGGHGALPPSLSLPP